MSKYSEVKERHQREVDDFPLGAAFSDKQFEEMMKKFGLKTKDIDKICYIDGGVFCKKADAHDYVAMLKRHKQELFDMSIDAEEGPSFAYDMFLTEFYNHECGYTGDFSSALDALSISMETILNNPILKTAFGKAQNTVLAAY